MSLSQYFDKVLDKLEALGSKEVLNLIVADGYSTSEQMTDVLRKIIEVAYALSVPIDALANKLHETLIDLYAKKQEFETKH